jgi:hypothetical protein
VAGPYHPPGACDALLLGYGYGDINDVGERNKRESTKGIQEKRGRR